MRPVNASGNANVEVDSNLKIGTLVEHMRFGKGKIVNIEGVEAYKKAELNFENGGLKKILLHFPNLNVLDS